MRSNGPAASIWGQNIQRIIEKAQARKFGLPPGAYELYLKQGHRKKRFSRRSVQARGSFEEGGTMEAEAREIEDREGYLYVRAFGVLTAANNIAHLRAAHDEAVRRGYNRILLDVTNETGDLSFLSRFYLADEVSTFWQRQIRLSVFARPEQLDPGRIAMVTANNRGISVQAHTDADEAIAWLLKP
ncbi:hypothetical protein HYR69_05965 [Candidatus Sumerlaeota bacterium]|nr:hypothetical protein [Candidatus Sumerlaeota bacterium]MBI3735272.1 hypothetical protein [Candidatus Sumerlaeota bacterium]